jgi:hypothetical protein
MTIIFINLRTVVTGNWLIAPMKERLKKIWQFLRPPLSLKEARQKGLRYFILIICVYLVRDLLLYVVLPLTACNAIFK